MDIHKPKPWHGVREFLKEYVIIVVGVLTALAAEQGAEWLHWRHQAEATEVRLEAEIHANLLMAYGRLITQRCYDTRLAGLVTQLRGHGAWHGAAIQRTAAPAPEAIPPYIRAGILTSASPPVYMSKLGVWPDGAWTSALASGVTLHIDQGRTDRYARLYRTFAGVREVQAAESETAATLSALAFDRDLSDADRSRYLDAVAKLSFWNVEVAAMARGTIESASLAGIRLRKSEVDQALESERHYFLTFACAEPVAVPLSKD